ncbi:MAG: polysaccharide deacetylase family protein [Rhizomicrobium sp.]
MSTVGRLARLAGNWIPAALARPFGAPAAVFFHGVERTLVDPGLQTNQHSLDAFDAMARLMKRDFDVMPLASLSDVLRRPGKYPRALFLMSDDGYANTLTNAAPVLETHGLPWTLFVSTHHIDTGEFSPPTLTRIFCIEAPKGTHHIADLPPFRLDTAAQRRACAESLWQRLKTMDAPQAGEALAAMKAMLSIDLKAKYASETFLGWDQVRALRNRGVEIGAHADVHWAMHDKQPRDWLRRQAQLSRQRIAQEVGPCRFFAYPFGNCGDVGRNAWEAVREAGYEYAFTTMAGTLNASTNPFLLPRYGLAPEEPNLAAFLPVLRANNGRLQNWQSQIGT